MVVTTLTRVSGPSALPLDTLVDRSAFSSQGSFRAVPVTISSRSHAYGRRATGGMTDDIFDRADDAPLASPRVTRWVKVD